MVPASSSTASGAVGGVAMASSSANKLRTASTQVAYRLYGSGSGQHTKNAGPALGGEAGGPHRDGPDALRGARLLGRRHRGDSAGGGRDPRRALSPLRRQGGAVPGRVRADR